MSYLKVFFVLFTKVLNILSWNNTSTTYINDYPYLYFLCYICDILDEYFLNYTYDVMGTFVNSPTTKMMSTTIVVPTISINISNETVNLSRTSTIYNILPTTVTSLTPSINNSQDPTALIMIPYTTTKISNPFLKKLNEINKMMSTSTTTLPQIFNSTVSPLITTTEITIEKMLEVPIFSFEKVANLLSNIENKITKNIIGNINITDFHDVDLFTTSFNSQINQLFLDGLSSLRNDLSSKNFTLNCKNSYI